MRKIIGYWLIWDGVVTVGASGLLVAVGPTGRDAGEAAAGIVAVRGAALIYAGYILAK